MITITPSSPLDYRDDLAAATACKAHEIARVLEAVRRAADDDEMFTLRRAEALCGLAAVKKKLEAMLDKLLCLGEALPEQDG